MIKQRSRVELPNPSSLAGRLASWKLHILLADVRAVAFFPNSAE